MSIISMDPPQSRTQAQGENALTRAHARNLTSCYRVVA